MKSRYLLLLCMLTLSLTQAMATIIDGVRQKPTYSTMDFAPDTEAYLYNVGADKFFSQGNAYGTQASLSDEGRMVKFVTNSASDYTIQDYCVVGSTWAWRNVFYDSEHAMYVDRASQSDYFFTVVQNGDGTFRISSSSNDPNWDIYAGLYFMGVYQNTSSTVIEPFLDPEGENPCYIDWVMISKASYESLASELEIYYKAQELKDWIDKIVAQNGDAGSLSDVYLNESSTLDQLQAAIDSAQPIYIAALINNAPDKENVDVTLALTNPAYENGTTGWNINAASGGNVAVAGSASNKCFEAWNNSNFDISQELTNLPVGVYEIEVQGFYRYLRDANAWNAYKAQSVEYVKPGGAPVYVYLNNNSTPFINIFDQPVKKGSIYTTDGSLMFPAALQPLEDGEGNWYPNEMYNSALAFANGMYTQSAYGLVSNSNDVVRIGVKGKSNQGNDSWVIWDNFKLHYRGFKPEVVQPVLETAMTDLQQYSGLLMGKTEYATLNNALSAAQAAIDAQDGEAMFAALNALYNVKESVIASKDLFLEEDVAASLTSLQEAITAVAESKLSGDVLAAANTLKTGIEGNTIYEGTQIAQLKSDVSTAINAINQSVQIYAGLNTAITNLSGKLTEKAYTEIINEATGLVQTATEGYAACTYSDEEASNMTTSLSNELTTLNASIEKYAQLAEGIQNLSDAIEEASAEGVHISATTLNKANLRLTQTQTQYNEGSIADDQIEARLEIMTQLISDLTRSIQLYNNLNEAIANLKAELDLEKMVAATVLADAQTLYDNTVAAYNDGTIKDEDIEGQITSLNTATSNLSNSASKYADLAAAIPDLEEAVALKAMKTLIDEAQDLLTETQTGYNDATIADADIDDIIESMVDVEGRIAVSAGVYATLVPAIEKLEAAIAEVSGETAHVSKTTLNKANLRLTQTQNQYNAGTISDDLIPGRITTIDDLCDELTSSVRLYNEFNENIAALKTELDKNAKVAAAVRTSAQSTYDTALAAYNAGTIDDENIASENATLSTAFANLTSSAAAYKSLNDAFPALEAAIEKKAMKTLIDEAQNLLTETQTGYNDATIADANIAGIISNMQDVEGRIATSATLYATLPPAIEKLEDAIAEVSGETDHVSQTTLTKANLRLTQTRTQYDEGSISDEQIPTRITSIDDICDELTASVQLYNQFYENIAALKTELDKNAKLAASVRTSAQSTYDTALAAYNAGSIDDANIAAENTKLSGAITSLTSSAAKYVTLNSAIVSLKNTIDANANVKLAATTRQNAQSVYEGAVQAYDEGSVNDDQVDTKVAQLDETEESLTNSANKYAQLANSNKSLSSTIEDAKSKKVSEELTSEAEQLLNNTTTQYNNGSINDSEIEAKITAVNDMTNSLKTAIDNIPAFITGKLPASGVATLGCQYDLDFSAATGIEEAYIVSSMTLYSAFLTQVTEIPGNSGVIIKGQPNAEYTIPVIFTATLEEENLLKAAVKATAIGASQAYILKDGQFHLVLNASTIPAGKAYLPVLDASNPARSIAISIDGKITNIAATSADEDLKDGTYYKNGKIFIIKNGKKYDTTGVQTK